MKNIFKIKYKLHHLINVAFYFVFFAIGFLLGGGSFEKIFENIVSYIKYLFNF